MNKNNILLVIATIAITWFTVWFFSNDQDIKRQLAESEAKRDKLKTELIELRHINDSLTTLKDNKAKDYQEKEKRSKTKDNEIQDTINDVYTLNEREIDSTIRHYTHKPYLSE